MADNFRLVAQLRQIATKAASEQSNPNSEKTPKKLSEVNKRLSGSQSDAVMAKVSNESDDSAIV